MKTSRSDLAFRVIAFLLIGGALVLECQPNAVVMFFSGSEPADRISRTFPYYEPMAFGYGFFLPMMTFILTCVLLMKALFQLCIGEGKWGMPVLSGAALLSSLLPPLIFGLEYLTGIGVCISLSLAAVFIMAIVDMRKYRKKQDDKLE